MRNLLIILAIGVLLSSCEFSRKPKVAFVSTHINFSPFEFREAAKSYSNKFKVDLFNPSDDGKGELIAFKVKDLMKYDLVVFEGLGARISLLQPQIDSIKQHTQVAFVNTPQAEKTLKAEIQKVLDTYWENGNIKNYKGMLSYIGAKLLRVDIPVIKPIVFPSYLYYHPDNKKPMLTIDEYESWYNKRKGTQKQNPSTIGLVYYQSNYVKNDLQVIDALIRNIEKKGHRVITLLGKGSFQLDSFFMKKDKALVDVVIYGGMFLDFRNPEDGIRSAKKLNVPLLGGVVNPYKDVKKWENDIGGAAPEMTDRYYFTEKDGVFETITIGGTSNLKNGQQISVPIPYQIDWRVDRALAWALLRKTNNADKKIVVTFYNEGGGKANIGSDPDAYLNVPASFNRLLSEWRKDGYSTGNDPIPSAEELVKRMQEYASINGEWTKEELEYRKKGAKLIRIPEEQYRSWFQDYPKEQQEQVIAKWGRLPGKLMVEEDSAGKKSIIIPMLEFGNILLAPHPSWGLQNNRDLIYADDPLPPNHAYIAFYEWMRREYSPHVFFSLFTQLSLMPGKLEGPSVHDFAGKLIGNIPHINSSPLIAGASVGNKRRANALTIGHTTDLTYAGLSPALTELIKNIEDWKNATNPAIRKKLADKISKAVRKERINNDLDIIGDKPLPLAINKLEKFIRGIGLQKVPQGSHILGEVPSGEKRKAMIGAMLGKDFKGKEKERMTKRYDSLLSLMPSEIEGLKKAFNGEYVESGPSGDPVRSPESLPAGRNPYPSNEKNIPTLEAWEIGKKMAMELLIEYEKKHGAGSMPQKVAFVLWSSEITHNQGVLEAEILYLLGVKPVWNSKGQVMNVELIPDSQLKRPRIDVLVTTSGTYRDHFMDKIQLLDKAVKLAAAADGPDNYVRIHSFNYQKSLGLKSLELAAQRIFSVAPGTYSTNIEFAIEDGESWQNDSTLSNLYINRMANSYGSDTNPKQNKELFSMNIKDVDAAAFGRSSNAHGIMDHPMVASYLGGINLAVKNKTGKTPDVYINDVSDPSEAKTVKLEDFYQQELHSRYLNPNWIKNMQEQGYEGARYMQGFTENLLAWDVTNTDMVTQEDWDEVFDTYVNDKNKLGLEKYFEEHNPAALNVLVNTLQKADRKGYWSPSEEQKKTINTRLDKLGMTDMAPSVAKTSPSEMTVKGYQMTKETKKLPGLSVLNAEQNTVYLWIIFTIGIFIAAGWVFERD